MTARITSPQRKQLVRFMEDGLDGLDLEKDAAQRVIERGGEMQEALKRLLAKFGAKDPNYELAREIIGNDFISPEEVAKARRLTYTDELLAVFGQLLPSQDVLEWCRDNGFMLVAGAPRPMSLLEIRELELNHFYTKEGAWYTESSEAFARKEKVETKWYILRKDPVPDSTSKNWREQLTLLSKDEVVPNAAEMVWGITTYKAVRCVNLLPDMYVRTSSASTFGYRVNIGHFDADGLCFYVCLDDSRRNSLGVSSSRKFEPRS